MAIKKILVSVAEDLLDQVDEIVATRWASRSDLIRDALRKTVTQYKQEKSGKPAVESVVVVEESDEEPYE